MRRELQAAAPRRLPLQDWRAVAIGKSGSEHLLVMGRNSDEVRKLYTGVFADYLTEDEQHNVGRIELQCWNGYDSKGRWTNRGGMPIPRKQTQSILASLDSL